jgi:hypothetical protein
MPALTTVDLVDLVDRESYEDWDLRHCFASYNEDLDAREHIEP